MTAARRLILGAVASLCALAFVLGAGAGSAWAEGGSFLFGPLGEEAGQIEGSDGIAVDSASGNVYVSDELGHRVEEFDRSGGFLRAWGWGVATGADEFQVCTTSCQNGLEEGRGAGAVGSPEGIAVDQGTGDVYVFDADNDRVEKFDPSGKFLLTFGGDVNMNGTDVCIAGEECQRGTEGAGDGEFGGAYGKSDIAVGPGGLVYVGDKARVQVFESSGVWKQNISLAGLSSEGKVTALAVNTAGDVFVKDESVPGVRELEPPLWLESPTKFDEGSEVVDSIAVDAAGHVFISEHEGDYFVGQSFVPCSKCDFLEYSSAGVELESFGSGQLVHMIPAMAYDEALGEILTYGSDTSISGEENVKYDEYGHLGVWGFPVPSPGPLVEIGSEKETPELRGAAKLEAFVNPEGSSTEVKFEYVDEADFKASGYASASSTTPITIGSEFSAERVEAPLPAKTLVPGVTYHWRVATHNSQGTVLGADRVFEEIPPAYIEGPWASDVTGSSVTLSAKINPLGASTSYRLEYGTSVSYGHVFSGTAGEAGMGYVLVSRHIQELQPDTVYHYRVVTESEVGTVEGADHTFTTQFVGGVSGLPDGRAWELVSPPNKKGGLIQQFSKNLIQAAVDGSAISYVSTEDLGEGVVGKGGQGSQILSTRTSNGWLSQNISIPHRLPVEGDSPEQMANFNNPYQFFSSDLSQAVVEPYGEVPPLSPSVSEQTVYLRDNAMNAYVPLATPANVPAGTKLGDGSKAFLIMKYLAATPDLSHIIVKAPFPLTPEASQSSSQCPLPLEDTCRAELPDNLYEWSAGRFQLVDILPDGEPLQVETKGSAFLGLESQTVASAVSSDGRWVVWMSISKQALQLYVRDMVGKKTMQMGGRVPVFQSMSGDGSKVFFTENGELYVFETATGIQTDLTTSHGPGERNAGVQNAIVGASNDGSYVYFVAKGVLATGAVSGADNLYVLHDGGGVSTIAYVATLSSEDSLDWSGQDYPGQEGGGCFGRGEPTIDKYCPALQEYVSSRVSPDGRYLAFMSDMPLTGYDNIDALSGQRDEEVYLYDAEANRLVCASCDPTGARPVGIHEGESLDNQGPLVDTVGTWRERWISGNIPGWYGGEVDGYTNEHQPRYLSDSGRLFFNSTDPLVPSDTNGLEDVYEYEPAGIGSCASASQTFSERSGGCVSLISAGTSAAESAFMDASENGDDAFFVTASKLTAEDYDNANDVYDAHVCSEAVACHVVPVSPPACTSGDSCKAAPSAQPEIFGPTPSATFSGIGNVIEEPKKSVVKPKHKAKPKPKKHTKSKKHKAKKSKKAKKARKSHTGASGKGKG